MEAIDASPKDHEGIFMRRKLARSRYTIIEPLGAKKGYLVLYTKMISGNQLVFLLDLFERVSALSRNKDEITHGSRILMSEVRVYTGKFGFDFVSSDRALSQAALRGAGGLWSTFYESQALQDTIGPSNIGIAATFLDERLELTFHMIDWKMAESFAEVMNLLGGYVNALTIIHSMRGKGTLETLLMKRFNEHHRRTTNRLRKHPDLVRGLDYIINRDLRVDSTTKYLDFVERVEETLVEAVEILRPDYVWLNEAFELVLASREYVRQIGMGLVGVTPRFGTTQNYLLKCSEIFHKTQIYAEIRVLAGKASAEVLVSLFIRNHDYGAYLKLVKLAEAQVKLYEETIPTIKRKNPGSVLDFMDAALDLLTTYRFAQMLEEPKDAANLYAETTNFVDRHNIRLVKLQLLWFKFLRTHDYEHLRALTRLRISDEAKRIAAFAELNLYIDQVAAILLSGSSQTKALDEAERVLEEGISPESVVEIVFDRYGLEYTLHLGRLLRAVLSCLDGIDDQKVESLRAVSRITSEELSPVSELQTLALKTQILYAVIIADSTMVESACAKLEKLIESTSPAKSFVDTARNWTRNPPDKRGLRFYQIVEVDLDQQDPWSRILTRFMKSKTRSELRPDDILDFDMVFFVEGKTDAQVYPILNRTLHTGRRFIFIDSGGWTNMSYFANAKVAKSIGKPIGVIFDGDTSSARNNAVKKRLVQELGVPEENIHTLGQGSLEDYLLVARAIKQAFPQIRVSLEDLSSSIKSKKRRNKKQILDALLRHDAEEHYDTSSASKIAACLRADEIDPELGAILVGNPSR